MFQLYFFHYCSFSTDLWRKLQKLQNKAAKVIFRCDRLHPSAPLRRELHWLPINERVIFKVLLLTFKGVNYLIPAYLSDFLIKYVSGRENLCSGNEHLLCVSRTKRAIGDCSFCVAGPRLWNSLPSHIRFSPSVSIFKKSLKTLLFPCDWFAFLPWYHIVVF